MKKLDKIVGVISILLSIHYFYSFRLITGILKLHGLDYMSIITFEDISYYVGNLTFKIILSAGFGLLFILIYHLIVIDEVRFRSPFKRTSQKINIWFDRQNKTLRITIIIIITILMLLGILSILYLRYHMNNNQAILFLSIVNFTIFPLAYIITLKNRQLILHSYLIFIFLYGFFFINSTIKGKNTAVIEDKEDQTISFEFRNAKHQTSEDTILIYNGSKYLILKAVKDTSYMLIPQKDIKAIKVEQRRSVRESIDSSQHIQPMPHSKS